MYVTLIYCFEGSLMELYMEEGTGLAPEDGMELLELSSLDLSVSKNGGLDITASDGAHRWAVTLYPRTGVEEVGEL